MLFALFFQRYLGAVELYASREDTIQRIRLKQSVRYRIRFPLQIPLPGLVRLSLNGIVLCARPRGIYWWKVKTFSPLNCNHDVISVSVTGPYVTLIKLEHTLYTEAVVSGNHSEEFKDNIHSEASVLAYSKDENYQSKSYTSQPTVLEESPTPPPNISTDGWVVTTNLVGIRKLFENNVTKLVPFFN